MHGWRHLLLPAVWVAAHVDVLRRLGDQFVRGDRRLDVVLVAAALVVGVWRQRPTLRPPTARPGPLLLLALVFLGELAAAALGMPDLRVALFGAGCLGIYGLYASPGALNAALPWAGLVLVSLPLAPFADVFFGFPARVYTADMVAELLRAWGVDAVTRETVLILDRPHGVAAIGVEAPCAGIRSLWTGVVFLMGAVVIEERRLDRWSAGAFVVTVGGVLFANLGRVATLVVLGGVLGWTELAGWVHVPLGLGGFVAAAGLGWWVLQEAGRADPGVDGVPSPRLSLLLVAPALAAGLLGGRLAARVDAPALAWEPPGSATPIPPTEAETRTFGLGSGLRKWRIPEGTLLVLPAERWRDHHAPEACLLAQGLVIDDARTLQVDAGFSVHTVRIADGDATAVYWFQARGRTTPDVAERAWASLVGAEERWVLVSARLDGEPPPRLLADFARAVRDDLAPALEAG